MCEGGYMEPASVEDEAKVEASVRGRDGIRLALRPCVDIVVATAFELKSVNDYLRSTVEEGTKMSLP